MKKDRKLDHIHMAFDSQISKGEQDQRFIYEPFLAAHPKEESESFPFLGKQMKAPVWISSMTGGTERAHTINRNIARACAEFGLGMGLGSCRNILFDKSHWNDFDVRDEIGNDRPLWANLGIAQVEKLIKDEKINAITDLVGNLRADGLIVHVNPLQEYFQPEGDAITQIPLKTIEQLLSKTEIPLIVKEVGQGMGAKSLDALLQLPLTAIEFAAFGGTSFSKLELSRNQKVVEEIYNPFVSVGQTAEQMLDVINRIIEKKEPVCKQLIISGGIKNYLDGYYLVSKSKLPAVYGLASSVLKHATGDYEELRTYMKNQLEGYRLAQTYLRVNPDF